MRVLIQRVKRASVSVDSQVVGKIDKGFLLFVGIKEEDDQNLVEKVANKIINMRIFDDEMGKMNLDLKSVGGSILSVSQFTLYAAYKKGNRPSFIEAASLEKAKNLYKYFNDYIRSKDIECQEGIFQAEMQVELINDGPVTILVDSDNL